MYTKANKILLFIGMALLLALQTPLFAQFNISNPYSRYGIGNTNMGINQYNLPMGGVGYALAKNNIVNPMNAASYFAVDSQSFVFNMGFDMSWRNLSSSNQSSDAFVASITNISVAFPIFKRLKIGLSLMPLTDIDYSAQDTIFGEINHVKTFTGSGGIDRFVLGLSYQPLKTKTDNLVVGANISYYFGNVYRLTSLNFLKSIPNSNGRYSDTTGFYNDATETDYDVSSFGFDFGVQYFHAISENDIFGIGAVFNPSYKLHTTKKQIYYTYYTYTTQDYIQDTLSNYEKDADIKMPMQFGVGLSYEKRNKLFADIDFTYSKWSQFDFDGQTEEGSMKDAWRLNAGLEFIPSYAGSAYYQKIKYRLGGHYNQGYIFLRDKRISDIGISFGMGLPIKKLGTNVNFSFEYGKLGSKNNGLIKEDYFRIGISISAKDRWFVKRKYQ